MSQIETDSLYQSFTESKDQADTQDMTMESVQTTSLSAALVTTPTASISETSKCDRPFTNSHSENPPGKPTVTEVVKDKALFCPYCEVQAKDANEFQEHVFRDEHIKTAFFTLKKIERGKKGIAEPSLPKKLDNNKVEAEKKKQPVLFHCQVCMISCNGENAWNAHLCGQKHRKVLEKQGEQKMKVKAQSSIKPLMKAHTMKPYDRPLPQVKRQQIQPLGQEDFQNYTEPLIGLEYVTEIQVMGQNTRYHCELCDCKFDGNLKFPHLVGAKHRFNVLKEKRPALAQTIRSQDSNKKRSELTGLLRDEAAKLENEEGRKMVKLRVEKSPFDKVNAGATGAGRGVLAGNRGGNPSNRGQYSNRGQNQSNRGHNTSFRGQSNRGGMQSNRGAFQSNRGATQTSGRGKGRGRGMQAGNWNQNASSSRNNDVSYDYFYGNANNQGSLLPKEAFKPMDESQGSWTSNQYQSFGSSSQSQSSAGNQDYSTWDYPQAPTKSILKPAKPETSQTSSSAGGLSNVLGDLSKLVSSEDDAAVALQVSNALTQALLTYRMNSMQNDNDPGNQPPS